MLVEQHKTRWFLPLTKTANALLSKREENIQSFCPKGLAWTSPLATACLDSNPRFPDNIFLAVVSSANSSSWRGMPN